MPIKVADLVNNENFGNNAEINTSLNLFPILPIPVAGAELPIEKAEEVRKVLVPKFQKMEQEDNRPPEERVEYSQDAYTSYGSGGQQIVSHPEVEQVSIFISSVVQTYATDILGMPEKPTVYFNDSWFTINRKYSFHPAHDHLPGVISGVYYVQAEEDDAPLTFHDLNKEGGWIVSDLKGAVFNEFTSRTWKLIPKTGRLVLFPSYVRHSVDQHLLDRERITISFNCGFEKKGG